MYYLLVSHMPGFIDYTFYVIYTFNNIIITA